MNLEQKMNVIMLSMSAAGVIIIVSFLMYTSGPIEPIESTRASILTCTVKSNIDGVITLNDDCKITEVK